MRFGKVLLFSVVLTMVVGTSYCAADDTPPVLYPVEKLARGIANVALGPLEILYHTYNVTQNDGGVKGITYGPLSGVCYFVARELVGVLEIATFLFPLPGCPNDPNDAGWGYGPYLRPAWVVDVEHNAFNFFFNEQAVVSAE